MREGGTETREQNVKCDLYEEKKRGEVSETACVKGDLYDNGSDPYDDVYWVHGP